MNVGPGEARDYAARFRAAYQPVPGRRTWFFPPAVSLTAAADGFAGLANTVVGAQDIHWEPKGAFTGAISAPLARAAGAGAVLIGHSERRHGFGETDGETGLKLRAALKERLTPVLCVGETLAEREQGQTGSVVRRQLLAGIGELGAGDLSSLVVAYEPVWAIGTGKTAAPSDAAQVHTGLRKLLHDRGVDGVPILYGGSVNLENIEALLGEPEIEGVLVGGASLDPVGWAGICQAG